MNESTWDANNNNKLVETGENGGNYVFERSNLLLMKVKLSRLSTDSYTKPPPRPRRVSSARPDTVNPPSDDEKFDREGSLNELKETVFNGQTVTTQSMGSSSSINREPPSLRGSYPEHDNNLLTLSHAPVHNGSQHLDDSDAYSSINFLAKSDKELDMVHRAPMKAVHFKQSTFKGSSMSALTLPRNHHEKSSSPLLNSFFAQKGKYKFYNSDDDSVTSDLGKPLTIRPDSAKLHQSDSPDFVAPSTSQSQIMMSEAAQKTVMTYGTLRKTHTTGSVTELFHKSKSKVRNSLRSWKLHGKTEKSVENPSDGSQDVLVRRPELYDTTVTKPDDYDETSRDWLSSSHDSASFYRRKGPVKAVLPVKVPTVSKEQSPKMSGPTTGPNEVLHPNGFQAQDGSREHKYIKSNLTTRHSFPNDSATVKSQSPNRRFLSQSSMEKDYDVNNVNKTPEQESIEILDSVIKSHAQARHSVTTSLSDAPSGLYVAETQTSDSEVYNSNIPVFNDDVMKQSEAHTHCQPDEPVIPQAFSQSTRTSNWESSLSQRPEYSSQIHLTHVSQSHILTKRNSDSLLSASNSKDLYSPYGSASIQSIKATPSVTPEPTSRRSPVVVPGLSITDVLTQEHSMRNLGSKATSSSESPRRNRSVNSFATSEMNSFDESSNSYTESQDFITSDGEELEEVVFSGGNIRKSGWLSLKPLLVVKKGKLEKSTRRKWQKYWVNLKGDQLLFYEVSEVTMLHESEEPALILPVHGSLVQAMPEHATKSNVMCLSTSHGSTYLLQAQRQIEVNAWIYSLHIEAATSLARCKREDSSVMTKKFILTTLQDDLDKMKDEIQKDEKMRKMAELQHSVVSDSKTHRTITNQINSWEENAERNHVHSFRLRCYLASLEAVEQPNPQSAIAAARKSSKQLLSNFKCFNIATLHCLVVTKRLQESTSRKRGLSLNLKRSGSFTEVIKDGSQSERSGLPKQKKNLFGSLRGFDTWKSSSSAGGKKKTYQRSPMTGIITALTSSSSGNSSAKYSDERLKAPSSVKYGSTGWSVLSPPSGEYDSANDRTLDTPSEDEILDERDSFGGSLDSLLLSPPDAWCMPVELQSSSIRVTIATNNFVTVTLTQNMNFRQLLEIVCQRKQLDSKCFYLVTGDDETEVRGHELVSELKGQPVKIRKKKQYSVELDAKSGEFGLTFQKPKVLCCNLVIENIVPGEAADNCGIRAGEEVLVINGELTAEMEDEDVAAAMKAEHLRLLIQTTNYDPESSAKTWWRESESSADETHSVNSDDRETARIKHLMVVMEEYLKNIVVPPPPIVSKQQPSFIRSPFSVLPLNSGLGKRHDSAEDILGALVIPPPDNQSNGHSNVEKPAQDTISSERCDELIQELLQKAETVTKMCKMLRSLSVPSLFNEKLERRTDQDGGEVPNYQLNDVEKIWKVLEELVETETNYVKDLDCLLNRFLEPLHSEGFLASPAMESLLQSVKNILTFQRTFLKDLTQSFSKSIDRFDLRALNHSLLSVTSTFLQHAAQFKLYAVFCTCHSVAQDLIEQTKSSSSEVRTFLEARNPKRQHSLSLDSYLIKPIQRVLKYPLLLRELLTFSEALEVIDNKPKRRLKAALHTMHAVARHINDSQTVHDEFGTQGFQEIMEQAALMALGSMEIASSLTLTNLLCYCTTEWQNAPDDVALRKKKGNFLEMLVLVFRSSIVLLCRSTKQREKKKPGNPQMDSYSPYAPTATTDFIFTDVIPGQNLSIESKCPGFRYAVELVSNDIDIEPRTYRLLCTSVESKQRIVKTVRYVIKDSMRSLDTSDPGQDSTEIPSDEVFTPRSISSARSTPTLKQRFFYLPSKQSDSDATAPPSNITLRTLAASGGPRNVIPMTLPLPTYKSASEDIVQSSPSLLGNGNLTNRNSMNSTSEPARSRSANRRSGLYITMTPNSHKLSENSFKLFSPNNQTECENDEAEGLESSDHQNSGCRADENIEGNPVEQNDFDKSDDSDDPPNEDTLKPEENSLPKLPKHSSPARYPVAYGASSFESDL